MAIKRLFLFILLVPATLNLLSAQRRFTEHEAPQEPRNKGRALLFHLGGGVALPGGDLADRFGPNASIGGGLDWISAGNFIFGLEGEFIFGSKLKEDPLANIRTPEGDIIGNDRTLATVTMHQRGLYLGGLTGKLFQFGERRQGLRVTFGAGYTRHKIRLQDDTRTASPIAGDYIKGYDRLVAGLAFQQFIGWQHLGANRRQNWLIGLELQQGFTHTLRDWDFQQMRKLDGTRIDLRFGVHAAWTLPFYQRPASEIEY